MPPLDRRTSALMCRACLLPTVANAFSLGSLLAVLLLGVASVGCGGGDDASLPSAAAPSVAAPAGRQEAEGKHLYDFYCRLCHGVTGEGDGFNAYNLDPRPQPLCDNPFMLGAADSDIAAVIAGGGRSVGKSVLMPPWGDTLDSEQIDALVAHLKTLTAEGETP